jgi:DNA polymerase-3 subunit epsilon
VPVLETYVPRRGVEILKGDVVTGYTVVDLETTGLFPQKHDRIVEIAIVSMSDEGEVIDEWSSLINPGRDVGPTAIHGITARDVLDAPSFEDVACHVIGSLSGRTLVAHNARFDTHFLDYEFERAGLSTRPPTPSLCTMELSNSYLRGASRKLRDCCTAASVPHVNEHTAIGDARAVAGLLRYYLSQSARPVPWDHTNRATRGHWWPSFEMPHTEVPRRSRIGAARRPAEWLDRISSQLPRNPEPRVEAYLDVLEKAMLDGYLSAHEEEALIEVAIDLGLHRDQIAAVHATFLDAMAIAAWEDGVVTDTEVTDLTNVARMLGLPSGLVRIALDRVERLAGRSASNSAFKLEVGDQVVFTGELSVPRGQLEDLVQQTGLTCGGITKKTKVVVAADPDSQSGKAAKARSYGIPVITEAAFARMLDRML